MLLILFVCYCQVSLVMAVSIPNPRVCVIGAGISGLSAARYLKAAGVNFTVLEATRYIGGTWRYDPRVGFDDHGLPVFTSMYKDLKTNLPKPTMELPGFPLPEDAPSFPGWKVYYEYLQSYTEHFDLKKYIKFLHHVVSVKREENKWKVKHKEVVTREEFEEEYDFVIVGVGHLSKPKMPYIKGEKKFQGTIIHSHSYRIHDPYKCRRVLIIGAGPSGMDIAIALTDVSRKVIHSRHTFIKFRTPFPKNYVKKPDVKELNETGAIFVDGTYEDIDDIIYCTGYEYDFPFIDESSNLTITKSSVTPLHKNVVNIYQPTMVMLGLVVRACFVVALDAQARYTTGLITGNFSLPSQEEMMAEWQKKYLSLRAQGRPLSHMHSLGGNEDQYYAELTEESGIERVPPVMFKIRASDTRAIVDNLLTYRHYSYKVLDSEHFTRTWEGNENEHERNKSFSNC
ncbi:senecionine N-oxygenase [Amyelois transitella]|uniref:senecionine N-oxygenase n=1 Tax=Amyelois transitella TaxID=680683 RepID=UPI0029906166|nr:senecionine N-oxygenase [Amyelois transitella]